MVITHFVLAGRGVTGVTVDEVSVVVVVAVIATCDGLFVTVATGLARVVWISALLARAILSFSLICSISSWSSWSSPGWGRANTMGGGPTATGGGAAVLGWAEEEEEEEDAEGKESTKLANEAVGPPFSHSLLFGTIGLAGPSHLALPTLASAVAMRASSRRVLRVSRLKCTRLKSRASLVAALSAVSLLLSLFHLAEAPGASGAGGPGGG